MFGWTTQGDVQRQVEDFLYDNRDEMPMAVYVRVEVDVPGVARVLLEQKRPESWWRRLFVRVADWLLGKAQEK